MSRRSRALSLTVAVLLGAAACQRRGAPPGSSVPPADRPSVATGRVADEFTVPSPSDSSAAWQRAEAVARRLKLPDGFSIAPYAVGFKKPRALAFASDGTPLVADLETGAIVALPDRDGDGRADANVKILERLDFPNSIAVDGATLLIAVKDGIYRSTYDPAVRSAGKPEKIVPLPVRAGIRHQTRTVAVGPDGRLYIAVSSTCDACEEPDERYAALLVADRDGGNVRVYAQGLRNTVYFTFDRAGRIWGNDMGQDDLGPTLPPDELNVIQNGRHYGWPYCYGNNQLGTFSSNPTVCQGKTPPAYAYPAHVAPLGIRFINSPQFPAAWQGDAISALHGSWNIEPPAGYKVVRLKIDGVRVLGMEDFITGWLEHVPGQNSALTSPGRPAYLAFDPDGRLFVVDDSAGAVFRVSARP